jgi:hypothetical protein
VGARSGWSAAAALAGAVAIGCVNPTVFRQILYADESLEQPPLMLVYDFAVDADDVVVDLFGPAFLPPRGSRSEPESRGRSVANTLAAAMVAKLRERGIRAERAGARTTPPREALLVKGQFVTVNGNGELPRMAIGLGSEQSMLRIQVQTYQVTETGLRRIAEREVGGLSLPAPAAPAGGPGAARPARSAVIPGGLTFVLRSQVNLEGDTEHLAELFAERAEDFYRRQGWL